MDSEKLDSEPLDSDAREKERRPMKAVMWDLPPEVVTWRKKHGADSREEMWEGVLHMGPAPSVNHQDIVASLVGWLRRYWKPVTGGFAVHEVAVAHPDWIPDRWRDNYRQPDVTLLLPERFARRHAAYIEGGPDVVVEVRSPGDESYDKLPFYAEVGVREAWIIHRDTRACEIFAAASDEMTPVEADDDGWLPSIAAGVELRATDDTRFAIRLASDRATETTIP